MLKHKLGALSAALALSAFMPTGALCQALTQQQEATDCQGDALRFCGPYIPDHVKIHACLVTYQNYLSPACRAIMAPAKHRRRH
jgi:hypothetical protein